VLLLGAVGCVPETSPAFDNDPLFGGPRLPRNAAVAAAPRPGAAAGAPLAAPPAAAGPAALAAGAPPGDANNLRIGPAPGAVTSAPHDGGDPWHSAGPAGATLQQPLADPSVRPSAGTTPPTGGAAAPAAGSQYEQLQEMLKQRGVQFQGLEGPDGQGVWRFRCGVPAKGDAGSTHNIEASAPGENGLAAMRGALKEIDQYQQQGP
jgi:hypothetical protein